MERDFLPRTELSGINHSENQSASGSVIRRLYPQGLQGSRGHRPVRSEKIGTEAAVAEVQGRVAGIRQPVRGPGPGGTRIHIHIYLTGASRPYRNRLPIREHTAESRIGTYPYASAVVQGGIHLPVRMEKGIHLEAQPYIIPAVAFQVKVRQGITSRVKTVGHLSAISSGIRVDFPGKLYICKESGKFFAVPSHHLIPAFETAVYISRKQVSLHILRDIEVEAKA